MAAPVQPADLGFFSTLAASGSLSDDSLKALSALLTERVQG